MKIERIELLGKRTLEIVQLPSNSDIDSMPQTTQDDINRKNKAILIQSLKDENGNPTAFGFGSKGCKTAGFKITGKGGGIGHRVAIHIDATFNGDLVQYIDDEIERQIAHINIPPDLIDFKQLALICFDPKYNHDVYVHGKYNTMMIKEGWTGEDTDKPETRQIRGTNIQPTDTIEEKLGRGNTILEVIKNIIHTDEVKYNFVLNQEE